MPREWTKKTPPAAAHAYSGELGRRTKALAAEAPGPRVQDLCLRVASASQVDFVG